METKPIIIAVNAVQTTNLYFLFMTLSPSSAGLNPRIGRALRYVLSSA
jgi:hypothetical protein